MCIRDRDEIVKAGATNFASAMYGKAPGIRITQTQGGSAGAVSINVRGLTSICLLYTSVELQSLFAYILHIAMECGYKDNVFC